VSGGLDFGGSSDELHEPLPVMDRDERQRLQETIGLPEFDDAPRVQRPRRRSSPAVDVDLTVPAPSVSHAAFAAIDETLRELDRSMRDISQRLSAIERRGFERDEGLEVRIAEIGRAIANVAERRLAMIELHDVDRRGRLEDIEAKLDKLLGG
jgi:hypothetical protein